MEFFVDIGRPKYTFDHIDAHKRSPHIDATRRFNATRHHHSKRAQKILLIAEEESDCICLYLTLFLYFSSLSSKDYEYEQQQAVE